MSWQIQACAWASMLTQFQSAMHLCHVPWPCNVLIVPHQQASVACSPGLEAAHLPQTEQLTSTCARSHQKPVQSYTVPLTTVYSLFQSCCAARAAGRRLCRKRSASLLLRCTNHNSHMIHHVFYQVVTNTHGSVTATAHLDQVCLRVY